ncbi:MAG: FemAB family XrtA/PEP-CTERM system-associated protein [Pseudomonadota bacterium]|nr:FemAB family XrtA/PEP-CTERM system-associated protein [Pseudomonadota bacterium]
MLQTEQISLDNSKDWDAYVHGHPAASPYHLMAWGQAVQHAYGHEAVYLAAKENDRICGVLPLVSMRVPLLGAQFCSLPFCDLGGVLADSDAARQALIAHAGELMAARGIRHAALRHSEQDIQPDAAEGSKVRMLLPLQPSADQQFQQFKSKLRSQVRKAGKNGVAFTEGDTPVRRQRFYQVMQVNMHQLGSPVHSRRWFDAVLDAYGDQARLGLVEFEGQIVGGAIILLCGTTVTVPWASTLPQFNRLSPNMLLYWGLLSLAADNGYKTFDFGRSTVGEGTYRFKKQWGAEPVPLQWEQLTADGLAPIPGSDGSGLRDKVATAWQKLPPAVVNWLGPILRRYISL